MTGAPCYPPRLGRGNSIPSAAVERGAGAPNPISPGPRGEHVNGCSRVLPSGPVYKLGVIHNTRGEIPCATGASKPTRCPPAHRLDGAGTACPHRDRGGAGR